MHWYVDANTLENFGAVDSMSVLMTFLDGSEPPHWTLAVRSEVLAAMDNPACAAVLECSGLGLPANLGRPLQGEVEEQRVRLGGGPYADGEQRGEAECLVMAEHVGGGVITDDGAAHQYISGRLPPGHTLDTIDVLKQLVTDEQLSAFDAKNLADGMRRAGRNLLWSRPKTLRVEDFMPRHDA